MGCSWPGSWIHGIFQTRVLEWVAISFSRGSLWSRDRIRVSHTAGRLFTIWATREAPTALFLRYGLLGVRTEWSRCLRGSALECLLASCDLCVTSVNVIPAAPVFPGNCHTSLLLALLCGLILCMLLFRLTQLLELFLGEAPTSLSAASQNPNLCLLT